MKKCNYNYKGRNYTEEQVKPLVGYHYTVEEALLASDNFDKIDGEIQVKISNGISNNDVKNTSAQEVAFTLKSVDILNKLTVKQKQEWNKFNKGNISAEQLVNNLQIPKTQKDLVIEVINTLDKPIPEQVAMEVASQYGFTVEINTAKKISAESSQRVQEQSSKEEFNSINAEADFTGDPLAPTYEKRTEDYVYELEQDPETGEEIYTKYSQKKATQNTQHYSNLTVLGGTNYTENEISTPLITPNIKGHAQFATDNGIGWFRSDEQVVGGTPKIGVEYGEDGTVYEDPTETIIGTEGGIATKTRRILETQSDLFQKGRDKSNLISASFEDSSFGILELENGQFGVGYSDDVIISKFNTRQEAVNEAKRLVNIKKDNKQNQFLQLLNKDNNWVTFFIKSIIQDSAKKGYEKVLFPRLDTIIQIESQNRFKTYKEAEGHYKDDRWKLEDEELRKTLKEYQQEFEDRKSIKKDTKEIEQAIINQKEKIRSHQPTLLNTAKFYENDVTNILNKTYSKENVKVITDEYGNTWNELTLNNLAIMARVNMNRVDRSNAKSSVDSVNELFGAGRQVATLTANKVEVDVNPIANMILAQSEGISENTEVTLRKAYNLEGVGEDTLQEFNDKASLMEARFAELGVKTNIIFDGDLNASGELLGTESNRYKELIASGEIQQGEAVIIINPRLIFSDTVFHEYGHIFIDLMGGMNNPRIKYAYSKIKNSALADQVREMYPELTGDNLAKEIMATAIGKEANEIFEAGNPDIGFIQKFIQWIRDGIRNLLGYPTGSVKQLSNELLGNQVVGANFNEGSLAVESQQFKGTKEAREARRSKQRMVDGAKNSNEQLARRINNSLAETAKSTDPEKVRFRETLSAMKLDIETLSRRSNLLAIDSFVNKATEISNNIISYLSELDAKADTENIQLRFDMLQKVGLYESLFDVVNDIRSDILDGTFKAEYKKEGWDDATQLAFVESIDKLKSNYDKIQELKVNVGKHHIANLLAPMSNRMVVNRRVELEQEYKGTNPRNSGESMKAYNKRISDMVNETIAEELPQLKKDEVDYIYERLTSSPADIGAFAVLVSSEKDLNSMIIQLASKLLDDADIMRDQKMIEEKIKAFEIFQAFDKETSGTDAKVKYKDLYQEGSDGSLYLMGKYNVEWYIQRNKLSQDFYNAVAEYGEKSDAAVQANETRREFDRKNTIIDTDTQIRRPNDKWLNKVYEKVMSKSESGKAKMLNYLENRSIENAKLLHGNSSLILNSTGSDINFIKLPSVGRNFFEKVTGGDYIAGVKDWVERQVKVKTDEEGIIGEVNDEEGLTTEKKGLRALTNSKGEVKYGVPIHFRGKMALKDISYDLLSSMMMDTYMAMNYHNKSSLQVELELMKDITANKKIDRTVGISKQLLYNGLNKKELEKAEPIKGIQSKEYQALQSIIENRLYGIKTVDTEFAKIASSLMSWTAQSMLIFNLPSGVANALQGKVFNFIEAVGGEYFDIKNLKNAENYFFKDMPNWVNDLGRPVSKSKTNILLDIFNVQGEFKAISSKFIQNNRFKALAQKNSGFAFNHMGEFYMHSTLMYSIMDKIKIKNSEGKFINKDGKVVPESKAMNLVEAIDVNNKGELVINKFAYKTSFGNAKLSSNLKKDKGLLEIKNLVNKIAHDLAGNYSEETQAMGQRYVSGKMISMYRKWVVPGFNKRWRGAVHFTKQKSELDPEVEAFYSEDMQAYQEGYYTTGARFLWQVGKNIKELKFHAISSEWDKLSDSELANMRRLSIEIGVMIASLAASTLLYMLAQGADDPIEKETLFYMTYFTRRLYAELRFYSNPVEGFKLMRDPSATLSYLAKIGGFVSQLQEDIFYNVPSGEGFEKFQAGKHKGKVKLEVRGLSLVPAVNRGYHDIEQSVGWLQNLY